MSQSYPTPLYQWKLSNAFEVSSRQLSATRMEFTMSCTCTGWLSIGWATNDKTSGHVQADMIVGWVANTGGAASLFDMYSNSVSRPTLDTAQNIKIESASQVNGKTSIVFSRDKNTGDNAQDVVLVDANPVLLQYAFHATADGNSPTNFPEHTSRAIRANTRLVTGEGGAGATGTTGNTVSANAGVGEFSSTTKSFMVRWEIKDGDIRFSMSSPNKPAYVGIAISPSDASSTGHDRSDMYVGWQSSAGAFVVMDGYSNAQAHPQWDAVQNVNGVNGSLIGNTLSFSFSRPLVLTNQGDVSIGNENLMLGWALGAANGAVQGTNIAQHSSSENARGGAFVNFYSGGSSESVQGRDPGAQYAITLAVLLLGFSIIQFSYRIFKAYSKEKESKKTDSAGLSSPLPINSEEAPYTPATDAGTQYPYNADFNSTGAFYFRGSVAVLYEEELRSHAGVQVSTPKETENTSKLGKLSKYISFQSDASSEKSFGGSAANKVNTFLNTRIPKTQVAIKDALIGIFFFILNIGFAEIWRAPGYSPGLAWGYLAAANSFFVALPATRNSVLVWLLGMPFDKTIMFHRWLGNFLVFESFIHLCYYAGKQDLYPDVYGTGVGAFVFLIFIALTSIGYIRRKYFNWFYASHFTFIAFYLLACLHSKKSVVPFTYAALFFYLLDRVLRLFWGAWPSKAVKMQIVNNAVQITFKKHFAAKYKVGQYVFLNFPQIALMEWHPFTLANGPDEEHLEVLIKGLGDHTKKLIEKAQSPFSDLWIRVDGPYGKWPYNFARYRAVALFAGGIGVTPSMALIRHVFHINRPESAAASEQSALKDVFFIWSCKSKREFDWYSQMLIEAMKRSASSAQYPSLHVYVHLTDSSSENAEEFPEFVKVGSRPDFPTIFGRIIQIASQEEKLRIAVVACGPSALVNDTWDQASKHSVSQNRRFDFHHETFEF